jgi:hypothetical protein
VDTPKDVEQPIDHVNILYETYDAKEDMVCVELLKRENQRIALQRLAGNRFQLCYFTHKPGWQWTLLEPDSLSFRVAKQIFNYVDVYHNSVDPEYLDVLVEECF